VVTPAAVVCVVDDDVSVRTSLARLVASAGYVVQTFGSAADFLAREPSPAPCCIVLDLSMPGVTGLDLQRTLAGGAHRIPVIFVTGHGTVPTSVAAMKAGAVDFLTKPCAGRELLEAIERAVARDRRDRDVDTRAAEVRARIETLTARERQVFALVVTGMLNKQIAAELGIVEKTVKVHRGRVMEKLRAGSFAELVRLGDRAGVAAARD
jgi:FixJ family two-component response regulator